MALAKSEYGFFNDYTGDLQANAETYKDSCIVGAGTDRLFNYGLSENVSKGGKDQTIKADAGKPRLSLVPTQILNDITFVRAFGCTKYPSVDSWKQVEPERYRDAAFRHLIAYINDPKSVDEESGLPHLWHLATNIAFLCELEKDEVDNTKG